MSDEHATGGGAEQGSSARPRRRRALDRERAEAPALFADSWPFLPSSRPGTLRGGPRFHTWGVCEVLLARSLAAAEGEAGGVGPPRLPSRCGAGSPDAALHVAPVVQDLEARAWALLGEADAAGRRPLRSRRGAPRGRRSASGTAPATCWWRRACWSSRPPCGASRDGPNEAAALLKQAEARYREIGEHHLAARAHHKRAQGSRPTARLRNIVFEPMS